MSPIKTLVGAAAAIAAMTTKASAEICLLFVCVGGDDGGGGGGGGQFEAPEIDVSQGFAAVAILACVLLLFRERFLRQRTAR
jgi:hypothetical protein